MREGEGSAAADVDGVGLVHEVGAALAVPCERDQQARQHRAESFDPLRRLRLRLQGRPRPRSGSSGSRCARRAVAARVSRGAVPLRRARRGTHPVLRSRRRGASTPLARHRAPRAPLRSTRRCGPAQARRARSRARSSPTSVRRAAGEPTRWRPSRSPRLRVRRGLRRLLRRRDRRKLTGDVETAVPRHGGLLVSATGRSRSGRCRRISPLRRLTRGFARARSDTAIVDRARSGTPERRQHLGREQLEARPREVGREAAGQRVEVQRRRRPELPGPGEDLARASRPRAAARASGPRRCSASTRGVECCPGGLERRVRLGLVEQVRARSRPTPVPGRR